MNGQWEQKRDVLAFEVTNLRSYEHITIRVAYDSPGALIVDVLKGIERWLM